MLGKELNTQEDFSLASKYLAEHPECEVVCQDGKQIVVLRDTKPETVAALNELEEHTGLTREIREIVLENDLKVSDLVKEKIVTMEQLASELRKKKHSWEK